MQYVRTSIPKIRDSFRLKFAENANRRQEDFRFFEIDFAKLAHFRWTLKLLPKFRRGRFRGPPLPALGQNRSAVRRRRSRDQLSARVHLHLCTLAATPLSPAAAISGSRAFRICTCANLRTRSKNPPNIARCGGGFSVKICTNSISTC